MLSAGSTSLVVLGKRKRHENLVLHLSGGSTSESDNDTASEFSFKNVPKASSIMGKSPRAPIIVNGKLVADEKKRYHCTFDGCSKSYRKPSRLEEHERTHTGERPYRCLTCQKTYFRESHLQAHERSHLPESSRPFTCTYGSCGKRFWTSQHHKRHEELHSGEKPFKCSESGCGQSFSKHNQLRAHISSSHCPPGTKNFRCEHDRCTKSFTTGQKLKAHAKTHKDHRYTCSHATCLQKEGQEFFPNWTALQAHTRTAHPPTCPYASCGKTFTQQRNLRAHLKLHEQREIEDTLMIGVHRDNCEADDEGEDRRIKRRRGGEVGRDWKCSEDGCEKDFKSKKALTSHVKIAHLHQRDFICTVEGCGTTFGYKHLLQRHAERIHSCAREIVPSDVTLLASSETTLGCNAIDILTGKIYEDRTEKWRMERDVLVCPHPDMSCLLKIGVAAQSTGEGTDPPCSFAFSRAYDFRRHLSSAHSLELGREEALALVAALRRGIRMARGGSGA